LLFVGLLSITPASPRQQARVDPQQTATAMATKTEQVTQLSLINSTTRLEISQDHQTWYHSIC